MESLHKWNTNKEIGYLKEYLQIESVHPNPNYDGCIAFLKKQADMLNLPINIHYPLNKDNPIVILTWIGLEPELPAILLNSHMDVVPVFSDRWTHPPFGAEMDEDGRIFARGSQDMKSVGMQYLSAIRYLKTNGAVFKRTIHLSFVADEEMGGRYGMRPFVNTPEFRALNIGFSLDEGMASPTDEIPVFNGERSVWRLYFRISGTAGHGSLLLKNTAGEKLKTILNKMMQLREESEDRLKRNPELTLGDVTSINLTRVSGGVQSNVIPPQMVACFDCRLALDVNHTEFEAKLKKFCEEAGGGIDIEYEHKLPRVEPTKMNDSNPYWTSFKTAIDKLNLKIKPQIFNGGTDSRYIRGLGIPAIGFSPLNNTPILLHDNDEFIFADNFLKGIDIYVHIITNLANTPATKVN
ncbi:aminoacylase-1-like [Teleopsis dalmanni]|uniref:aminoacylase-1-like n=1 Tax=Teleopsis dalmanni TaxID=139649 RepID=UPI0018CE792D|nr:aminoacylase-1-like [Teleopsis dalmanni]